LHLALGVSLFPTAVLLQLDAALMDLSSYSHLAFTSKNGILAVLQRLQQLKGGKRVVVR
jgi:uroporphyrinogen-III synthase